MPTVVNIRVKTTTEFQKWLDDLVVITLNFLIVKVSYKTATLAIYWWGWFTDSCCTAMFLKDHTLAIDSKHVWDHQQQTIDWHLRRHCKEAGMFSEWDL